MNLLKRISKAFFGDSNKEETTLAASKPPKPPRKGKLTYKGKSLEQTKNIIHNQKLKSSEEFNKNVRECKEWLDDISTFYQYLPFYYASVQHTIGQFNQKELAALKVAISDRPDTFGIYDTLNSCVNKEIERNMKKYVFRKGKQ